jgi:hypothetical protein
LILLFAAETSAAKRTSKATTKAATKAAKKKPAKGAAELTIGTECELKMPVSATTIVGKKRKKTKLAKAAHVTITQVGSLLGVSTASGEATVKKALLAKACHIVTAEPQEAVLAEEVPVEPVRPSEAALAAEPVRSEAIVQPVSQPVSQPTDAVVEQVLIAAEASPSAAAPPLATTRADVPVQKPRVMRGLAIALTTVGALGIAGGGTLLTLSLINNGQLNARINAYNADPLRPRATFETFAPAAAQVRLFTTLAIVTGAVGVAALTTGIVLFAVDKAPNDVATFKLAPTFAFSANTSHVGVVGQF